LTCNSPLQGKKEKKEKKERKKDQMHEFELTIYHLALNVLY